MKKIFSSREIFLRLINCSFCWLVRNIFFPGKFFRPSRSLLFNFFFLYILLNVHHYDFRITITLVYYGLSLSSVELNGDKYLNFMLVNAIEVPAFLTSWYFMEHYSRRKTQAFSFLFSGIGCVLVNLVQKRKLFFNSKCLVGIFVTMKKKKKIKNRYTGWFFNHAHPIFNTWFCINLNFFLANIFHHYEFFRLSRVIP